MERRRSGTLTDTGHRSKHRDRMTHTEIEMRIFRETGESRDRQETRRKQEAEEDGAHADREKRAHA